MYELLGKYRNEFESPPVLTTNFITHNIDYNHKKGVVVKGLSHYLNKHKKLKNLYVEGIMKKYISPQLHGYAHYDLKKLNRYFKTEEGKHLFKAGFLTGKSTLKNVTDNFRGELIDLKDETLDQIKLAVKEFYNIFGYFSESIIPPYFEINLEILGALKDNHIIAIQASNRLINSYYQRVKRIYFRKQNGLYWIPRNARLDPHPDYGYYADNCLKDIKYAFDCKIPAVIDFHRVNISGRYNPAYRKKTLNELKEVFEGIKNNWPDAKFISTQDLLKLCQI